MDGTGERVLPVPAVGSTGIDRNVHPCEFWRSPSMGLSRNHGMFAPDSGVSDVAGELA